MITYHSSSVHKVEKARELEIPMVTEQFVLQSIVAKRVLPSNKFLVEKDDEDNGDDDEKSNEDEDDDEEELQQPPYTHEYFGRLQDEVIPELPDWYKDQDQWKFVVSQWFQGVAVDSYWALLGKQHHHRSPSIISSCRRLNS